VASGHPAAGQGGGACTCPATKSCSCWIFVSPKSKGEKEPPHKVTIWGASWKNEGDGAAKLDEACNETAELAPSDGAVSSADKRADTDGSESSATLGAACKIRL